MFKTLFKLLLPCLVLAISLSACEKQKQASAEVGALPKQIMDKATNDLNNAVVLDAEKAKAAENVDAPANVGK